MSDEVVLEVLELLLAAVVAWCWALVGTCMIAGVKYCIIVMHNQVRVVWINAASHRARTECKVADRAAGARLRASH